MTEQRRRPWEYASAPLNDLMGTRFWDLLTATTDPQAPDDVEMGSAIREWCGLPPEVREYIGMYLDAAQLRLMEELRGLALRNATQLRAIRGAIHASSGNSGGEEKRPQRPQRPQRPPQPAQGPAASNGGGPSFVQVAGSGELIEDPFAALDASGTGVALPGGIPPNGADGMGGDLLDENGNPVQMP